MEDIKQKMKKLIPSTSQKIGLKKLLKLKKKYDKTTENNHEFLRKYY